MSKQVNASVDIVVRDVDGWPLAFTTGDDEPRIRDGVLGERLGYDRPRKIRELIERHHTIEKNLNDYEVRPTVGQTSPKGGRPGIEYWLTEAAALFIVTKSETAAAVAVTKDIIRVFQLARRGQLPNQQPALSEERIVALLDAHAQLTATKTAEMVLAKLEEKPLTGTIGPVGGNEIKHKLRRYGYLMAGNGGRKEVSSWRSAGDIELRGKLGHSGAGSSWDELPLGMLASARRILDEMLKRAQRIAGERAQIDLPIPPPKAA